MTNEADKSALHDLLRRCCEVLEWHKTGLLPDGALRAHAARIDAPLLDHERLRYAEDQTAAEAMRLLITLAQPETDVHTNLLNAGWRTMKDPEEVDLAAALEAMLVTAAALPASN